METRSPVASSEITCSPGHNFPSDWTPAFAPLRVSASSTKCRLPSSRILKMQKRRRIQTPNGDDVLGGQWSNYRIKWCVGYRLRDSQGRVRNFSAFVQQIISTLNALCASSLPRFSAASQGFAQAWPRSLLRGAVRVEARVGARAATVARSK